MFFKHPTVLSGASLCYYTPSIWYAIKQLFSNILFIYWGLKVWIYWAQLMNTKAFTCKGHAPPWACSTALQSRLHERQGPGQPQQPQCVQSIVQLTSAFQNLINASCPQTGIPCLNAPQAVWSCISVFLPLCNQDFVLGVYYSITTVVCLWFSDLWTAGLVA